MHVIYSSPWIPAEWIAAHGLVPRGLWSLEAEHSLPVAAGVCAFAESFARLAETRSDSAFVFATTCDQMRRAFDSLPEPRGRCFLFNIPATWQSGAARNLFRAEVQRLGRFLEDLGGAVPTSTSLAEVMRQRDQARRHLREAIRHWPARKSTEAIAEHHGNPTFFNRSSLREEAHSLREGGWSLLTSAATSLGNEADSRAPSARLSSDERVRVHIALVGAPLCPAHWPLLNAIEGFGGRVVLNGTEPGERSLLPELPSTAWSHDPLATLANCYFDAITDVFQRPNSRLYDWLGRCLKERGVQGIIVWSWMGCDLWRAEAASLREAFNLPVLLLEAGETPSDSPRELGRLQAFVEMLQ